MTKTIDRIELHDSRLSARAENDELVLDLDPAYVQHWEFDGGNARGTGCWQHARIRVSGGKLTPPMVSQPADIVRGWIQAGSNRFDGLVPAPLLVAGNVAGQFDVASNEGAQALTVTGTAVRIELLGLPRGSEPLPPEWAPEHGGA